MTFSSTSAFQKTLDKLSRKPKEGYANCRKDACGIFKKCHTIDDVINTGIKILELDSIFILKNRVPNSNLNLSKSNGYRLFCIVNRTKGEVTMLHIYPKKGKYAEVNLSDKEIETLLENYLQEYNDKTICEIDIETGKTTMRTIEENTIQAGAENDELSD